MRRAVALALVLSVAACTPETSSRSSDPRPSSSPVLGGGISVGMLGEPATLDPYGSVASDLTYALVRPVYRMPYRLLPDGSVEPDLALDLETDGKTAVLTLEEAHWSNGKEITSRDVVRSIERALPPSGFATIRAARVVDNRRIELRGAVDSWEETLASGAFVLPGGKVRGRVAAGPWRFSEFEAGRLISYVPNPSWDGPALSLDRLTVDFVNTTEILLRLLERGEIDAAAIPWTVNLDERLDALEIPYDRALGWEAINIAFDPHDLTPGQWQAVAGALDRQLLVDSFVRDDGTFSNTLAPGPSGSEGFWSHAQIPDSPLPSTMSLGAPEGDEMLGLMHRAIQLDLERKGMTVELISGPLAIHYGRWADGGPADASLLRVVGAPGAAVPEDSLRSTMLPLAHIETLVAWNPQVMGVEVHPSLDGVLWNAEKWWKDPSI